MGTQAKLESESKTGPGLAPAPSSSTAQPPNLRQIVIDASRALALLDAVRLDELALTCSKLDRDLASLSAAGRADLAWQSREAAPELAVFARVLDATRANLGVMLRLRDLREGRLEYGCPQPPEPERLHGHD
jgi:hypothetical protein